MNDLTELKKFAHHLAEISADIIRPYFRTDLKVNNKGDNSPVTIADKKAEEKMREAIMKEYPNHGIVGEEFGNYKEDAEYKWVLDPIDGTKSFICGALSFGTLIALTKTETPILGVINHPVLNQFLIGDNNSAFLNGEVTVVKDCENISQTVLLTTDHYSIEKYQNLQKFEVLAKQVKFYRQWGDCYGYYLLASGYANIMIDPIMSVWDKLALIPIIKGAGGVITDYQGNDAVKGNSIIAASPGIHSKVIKILND